MAETLSSSSGGRSVRVPNDCVMKIHRDTLTELQKKVPVRGVPKNLPKWIAADRDLRDKYAMIDVAADGNCGAYVLSLVNFALNNVALSAFEIRDLIIAAPKAKYTLPLHYACATQIKDDGSMRYLEQGELALFCAVRNVNCIVIKPTSVGESRTDNAFTAASNVVNPERPYAIFVNTLEGAHYEMIVKSADGDKTRTSPIKLLLDGNDAGELLQRAHSIYKAPPDTFFNNFDALESDFDFIEPSRAWKSKKRAYLRTQTGRVEVAQTKRCAKGQGKDESDSDS